MTEKEVFKTFLTSKPIAFYPDFSAVAGSTNAGVLLSQLLYWKDKELDPDGWIYKTQKDWLTETSLTRSEQETARKKLRDCGVLEEKLKGNPAKLYYRINFDSLIIALKSLYESRGQDAETPQAETPQASMAKVSTLSLTKNTTKNTEAAALWMPKPKGVKTETKSNKAKPYIDLSPIEPVLKILREHNKNADKSISLNLRNLIRNEIEANGEEYVCAAVRGRIAQAKATGKELWLTAFFDPDRAEWRATCAEIGERKQNAPQGLESGFKSTLPDFSHIKYDDAPIDEEAWQTLTGSKN